MTCLWLLDAPMLFKHQGSSDFKCKKCRGEASNMTIPDIDPVYISGEEIKKVRPFCYL